MLTGSFSGTGLKIHRFVRTLENYELEQHINAINVPHLLVVSPEKGFWILKSKKDSTITLKKEDNC